MKHIILWLLLFAVIIITVIKPNVSEETPSSAIQQDTIDTSFFYQDTIGSWDFEGFDFNSNVTILDAETVFVEGANVVIIKNSDTQVYLYEKEPLGF